MNRPSPIWTELDWDRNGKQVGTLNLPYSVTRSAYGVIAIPACVVKNGTGPTLPVFWQTGSDLSFASHAAMAHGTPYLGGEYGGSGAVAREGVALIGRGIRRLMAHMGLAEPATAPPDEPVRMVKVPSREYF